MNANSTTEQSKIEKLRIRWATNPIKKMHLQDILSGPKDFSWFHKNDQIDNEWEEGKLSDTQGLLLKEVKIDSRDLYELALHYAVFDNCTLHRVSFLGSVLSSCILSGCDLIKSIFCNTFAENVVFKSCSMNDVSFEWSSYLRNNFISNIVDSSQFDGAKWEEFNCFESQFKLCKWFDSKLDKSIFIGNNFNSCEISLTNISNSKITDTAFNNCEIGGVDFRGCSFKNVEFKNCKFTLTHMGSNITPTRFDDLPHIRAMVEAGGCEGLETIEWCIPEKTAPEGETETYTARLLGGELCIRSGYWWTPAKADSRQWFEQGALMPSFETDFGVVIWQWDENQN